MSLPALLSGLVEFVGDVVVNDCGQPVPDRVLRYHGALPADCCSDAGVLAATWSEGHITDKFPVTSVNTLDTPCSAAPVFTLVLRYMTCWPVPEVSATGVEVTPVQDAEYDAAASRLAGVAECVARALARIGCAGESAGDAIVALLGRREWLRFIDVTPILPSGGCAGVQWRVYATPGTA